MTIFDINPACIESFRKGVFDRRLAKKKVQESFIKPSSRGSPGSDSGDSPGGSPGRGTPQLSKCKYKLEDYVKMSQTSVTEYHPCLGKAAEKKPSRRQRRDYYQACSQLLGYIKPEAKN